MKFCIIDDDPTILKMITAVLGKAGHEVVTETSGHRAIETALAAKPDCVITDMMMAPVDGLEICQSMRRHPELKDVPIIMLSSNTKEKAYWEQRAKEFGADGYMAKPITPGFVEDLQKLIEESER